MPVGRPCATSLWLNKHVKVERKRRKLEVGRFQFKELIQYLNKISLQNGFLCSPYFLNKNANVLFDAVNVIVSPQVHHMLVFSKSD